MDNSEFDVRGFLSLLRRQARLIILTIVVVLIGASITVFTLKPMYTASTLILVDPSRKNLLEADFQSQSTAADSARIDSEVEILRSDNVLLQVIRAQNMITDPEFGVTLSTRNMIMGFLRLSEPTMPTGEAALNQSLSKLRSAVNVQRRGSTYLMSLQVRSASATRAAELANAISQAYITDQLRSKVNGALAARDILQARVASARESIVASETQFDDFVSSNLAAIVRDTGRTELLDSQGQIDELIRQRQQSSILANQLQASLDAGDFSFLTEELQSEAIAELERQRVELQASLSTAAEGTPAAVNLQAELQRIEDRLRNEANAELGDLRAQLTATQTQEGELRDQLRNAVLQSPLSADTLTQLYELQQGAAVAQTQYQQLLRRIQDLEAQAALQVADSRVVSPALAPNSPSFPNTPLILAIAAVTALGLGVAVAFLYENVLGGFTSAAQLESVLRIRVASATPRVKSKNNNDGSYADLMVEAPLSVYAESVRRVRAMVDHSIRQTRGKDRQDFAKVIMISSSSPGEGKTTLALSLARSYALAGSNTLLIDCDLRKPSVHRQLKIEPSNGLLEFLSDESTDDLRSFVQKDPLTSATVVVGNRRSGLPTDQLVAGLAFQRIMSASSKMFDVIVVDTPPIGPVVDGIYIAPFADAVIFLTRWASTSQREAKEAVRTLQEAVPGSTEIFAVLSQQDSSRGSYKNKYGDYYAEYG